MTNSTARKRRQYQPGYSEGGTSTRDIGDATGGKANGLEAHRAGLRQMGQRSKCFTHKNSCSPLVLHSI